jgi:hypothetical protein
MTTTRRRLTTLAIGLCMCSMAQAEPHPAPTPACPSLTGSWYGTFGGGFSGAWGANFEQIGSTVNAAATVVVDGIGELQAYGNATAVCKDGTTTFSGNGSAGGRSGSFAGKIQRSGDRVSGTWAGAGRSGTWKGERSQDSEQ